MYRFLLFLLLLLCSFPAFTQVGPATCGAEHQLMEKESAKFRSNNVYKRTIWKYRIIEGVLTKERERIAIDTYHSSGNIAETAFYDNDDDVNQVLVYNYNKAFQMLKKSLFNPMGGVIETWDYSFDKEGNLIQESHISSDKAIIDWKTFKQLEDIQAVKSFHFDSANTIIVSSVVYYSNLDTGIPVKKEYYLPNGDLDYSITISNEQNRVIKKEIINNKGELVHSLNYRYTPDGVLSEIKKLSPRKEILGRKIYKHDENNLLTAYTEYDEHGGMLSFYRYTYIYF